MPTQLLTGLLSVALLAPLAVHDPTDGMAALHEQLLDALDREDSSALKSLLSDSPTLFVLDENAEPVLLTGSLAVDNYVSLWARDIEDPVPTKLLSCSVVSQGPTATVVVFEFERPMTSDELFRATSILVAANETNGSARRIQHLHVSPASRLDLE
tara:strand:- start:71 stop:538 length:468 start_codon:yes stop_codon:yes gene_type:complete